MADVNTSAFESDVMDAEERKRRLNAELASLEADNPAESTAADTNLAVPEEDSLDSFDEDDAEPAKQFDSKERSDVLGRNIRYTRPTGVAVAIFQSDAVSSVVSDVERMAAMGDFCREYIHPEDFQEWRRECLRRGSGPFFYESMASLVDMLVTNQQEDDEKEWKEAQSRVKRRAALKAKQRRENNKK